MSGEIKSLYELWCKGGTVSVDLMGWMKLEPAKNVRDKTAYFNRFVELCPDCGCWTEGVFDGDA